MSGLFGGDDGSKAALAEQKKQNEEMRKKMENDQRDMAARESSRNKARATGGSRSLLSDERVNPEQGVTTLGG